MPGERRADAQQDRIRLAQAEMAKKAPPATPAGTIMLPQTATDAELKMMLGAVLLALSFLVLLFNRRPLFARWRLVDG